MIRDQFAEMYVAGVLADAGWNIYLPHRDVGFDMIATFASVFPTNDPKYILIVTLDEPVVTILNEARRTAGFPAVPVAAEIIRRVAPLLGLKPEIEQPGPLGVTLTAN